MKFILNVILLSMLSLTSAQAMQSCGEEAEIQLVDAAAQQLGETYEDALNQWQITLTSKGQDDKGNEIYWGLFNTYYGVYEMNATLDERCDIVEFDVFIL